MTNKIFNYKEAVTSIYLDEDVSFFLNTDKRECGDYFFCDLHHKHIILGDLRIIKHNKLKKLLATVQTIENPK